MTKWDEEMSGKFMNQIESNGLHVALKSDSGDLISYQDLATKADIFAEGIPSRPALLLIEMQNEAEAIIAYVGALRCGVPVILGAPGSSDVDSQLVTTFKPNFIYSKTNDVWSLKPTRYESEEHNLHPDLAVMLSTSGSTGSAKLVKLSYENIGQNARSISEYLEISQERVAITSLPAHYSYGLSIINSFLFSGATIVLTDESVVADKFWSLLKLNNVTDLAGVPYTYELLERLEFRRNPPPSLRVMTQAGGRLPPDLVEQYANFSTAVGIKFFVMYGQTEATARMAYLPPDLAAQNPDCIGVAIPRGSFSIMGLDENEISTPDQPGELVYSGPNVMMGYAHTSDDLAAGQTLTMLHTGDIAKWQKNKLIKIIGRSSRFSKIAGLRIGFDDVESIINREGVRGYVTGNDMFIAIGIINGDPEWIKQHVSAVCGIPSHAVHVWTLTEVPTLGSGKINYQDILKTGQSIHEEEAIRTFETSKMRNVSKMYSHVFNQKISDNGSSFSNLGGDSLAYVSVSVGLEEMLGQLPQGWENMPISALQLLVDAQPSDRRALEKLTIGMDVFLRFFAISLIFIGHGAPDQTEWMRGGSSILFCLSGYSMAMFQLPFLLNGKPWGVLKGIAVRLILPYLILVTALLAVSNAEKTFSWYLLMSVFELTPEQRGPLFSFWFMETLVHSIFLTCMLFLIPKFRNAMRSFPFLTVIYLVLAASALRLLGARFWPNGNNINLTFDGWIYVFFIGWAIFLAKTTPHKIFVFALTVVLAFDQFGFWTGRAYWLSAAVAILLVVPSLSINRRVGHILVYFSSATYFMYLAHALVVHFVRFELPTTLNPLLSASLVYSGSILLGLIGAEIWRIIMLRSQYLLHKVF